MSNLFLYSTHYLKKGKGNLEAKIVSVTVIFCDRLNSTLTDVQSEVSSFYQHNYQTDEIFVIGGAYDSNLLDEVFIKNQDTVFKGIPKLEQQHLSGNLFLFEFSENGNLNCKNQSDSPKPDILNNILKIGLIKIFKERGGLIEANGNAHHFVFPSGKHSKKFLRTGNILLHSPEIFFIAFCLLPHFTTAHQQIFCDTSSINTLAFALEDLKRRLVGESYKQVPIHSFSSYSGLFDKSFKFFGNSLVLISSSTSGNIIKKLLEHDSKLLPQNIIILYFLGKETDYNDNRNNILCDLTKRTSGDIGIEDYLTSAKETCLDCQLGSYPVEIKGDVFLLEKPKINRITLKVTDAPGKLAEFVEEFRATKKQGKVLKVNYKENGKPNIKYEVYFDMHHVLCSILDEGLNDFADFKCKLNDYINQYIPSNVKYLIPLPDEGSEKLAEIVLGNIRDNYQSDKLPKVIRFDDFSPNTLNKEESGAIVILGSCISNGKNLLYLSRALRDFNKLKLVYFVALMRTSSENYHRFLRSNLTQGSYGKDTHSLIEVLTLHCNRTSHNTTWVKEIDFLKEILELLENNELPEIKEISERLAMLTDSMSSRNKGLASMLFYPDTSGTELELRKGFVFYQKFKKPYADDVSQADVYFTISAILNSLRSNEKSEQSLSQSEYVRNIIDPGNFHRYNDGIIQASILRAAERFELSYHIDDELSNEMAGFLEKMVEKHNTDQGEGLVEFIYALAIGKMTLKPGHIQQLLEKLNNIHHPVLQAMALYIQENVMPDKHKLVRQVEELEKENLSLKSQLEEAKKTSV